MLRATSEIAVASSVWSVLVSSSLPASSRARWRAVTTSESDSIGMIDWRSSATVAGLLPRALQQREPLLEVERGRDVLEAHAELDHREGHFGLDAHDDRLRSAQPRHPRDALQRPRHERVHDVERRDVDDDPPRAMAGDLRHHVVAQLQNVRIRQRRLDRGDQELSLLEDRDGHYCIETASSPGVSIDTW